MSTKINDLTVFQCLGLKIVERAIYRGPHFYSQLPMIRLQIALRALEEYPTNKLSGFQEGLVELLPGLQDHGCSYKKPGGFLRRMEEGTWLGHVIEHVALELQSLAGSKTTRGKTRSVRGKPGVYNVLFTYNEEQVGLLAGRLAVELVASLLPDQFAHVEGLELAAARETTGQPFNLESALEELRSVARKHRLGPTTASIVAEAERRGIPVLRLDEEASLLQLGYGKHQKRVRASISGLTSEIATEIAGDKDLTKTILRSAGLPVPEGSYVQTAEGALNEAKRLGYPVVIKLWMGITGEA